MSKKNNELLEALSNLLIAIHNQSLEYDERLAKLESELSNLRENVEREKKLEKKYTIPMRNKLRKDIDDLQIAVNELNVRLDDQEGITYLGDENETLIID